MKKIILISTFLIATGPVAFSQLKHDYVWTIGYGKITPSPSGYPFGGVVMDFNDSPLSLTLTDYIIDRPKATISDKDGCLVAYTDGCRIINRKHKLMLNGDTLNPGEVFNGFCAIVSYPLWQPTIFLPKPGSDSLYYLFHIRDDDYFHDPMNLMYSILDATGDGGDGIVISKNNPILSDSIYLGDYVTATRHGNGRDWWIVVPRRFSNGIHVSLLTPEGVEYKGTQNVFSEIDSAFWGSQAAFSQDGNKYFRNSQDGLLMLDFDRCNGTFSRPIYLDWDSNPFGGYGTATSPNSRFLYLTSGGMIQQYDLWASDLASSMVVVAEYDGTLSPHPTNFFQMMPGPDGRIYVITSYSNNVLHVIHNPDEPGIACNVEQHAITLPARTIYFVPNFANYNLEALDPPCNTSGGTAHELSDQRVIKMWPNPAVEELHLKIAGEIQYIMIFDATGREVNPVSQIEYEAQTVIDVRHLPKGLYYIVLRTKNKIWNGKFVRG